MPPSLRFPRPHNATAPPWWFITPFLCRLGVCVGGGGRARVFCDVRIYIYVTVIDFRFFDESSIESLKRSPRLYMYKGRNHRCSFGGRLTDLEHGDNNSQGGRSGRVVPPPAPWRCQGRRAPINESDGRT